LKEKKEVGHKGEEEEVEDYQWKAPSFLLLGGLRSAHSLTRRGNLRALPLFVSYARSRSALIRGRGDDAA